MIVFPDFDEPSFVTWSSPPESLLPRVFDNMYSTGRGGALIYYKLSNFRPRGSFLPAPTEALYILLHQRAASFYLRFLILGIILFLFLSCERDSVGSFLIS